MDKDWLGELDVYIFKDTASSREEFESAADHILNMAYAVAQLWIPSLDDCPVSGIEEVPEIVYIWEFGNGKVAHIPDLTPNSLLLVTMTQNKTNKWHYDGEGIDDSEPTKTTLDNALDLAQNRYDDDGVIIIDTDRIIYVK